MYTIETYGGGQVQMALITQVGR